MTDRKKLEALIAEAEELIQKYITASDPQFGAWHRKVERLLLGRYGKDSYEYNDFHKMGFSLPCFSTSTPDSAWRDACTDGLARAKEVLKIYLEDMDDAEIKMPNGEKSFEYDVFISHASQNKKSLVDSLCASLIDKLGVTVWYDTNELEWGDNWKEKINDGLKKCRFAIVILSPEFLNREWTERELYELLNRQDARQNKLVLPLLYNLTVEQMKERYPVLESIQAYPLILDDVKDITIKFARIFIKELKASMSL